MAKVYLAVGHGRRANGTIDPGAVLGDASEQNQGGPIVAAAAARLQDVYGQTVKFQRPGDPNYPGYTAEANSWQADVAVTVHHDWSKAPRGSFGHWHSGSADSRRLADAIYAQIVKAGLPTRPSWHKPRDELYFVRHTKMPAVLWECDRVGSVEDLPGYGRLLADGIAAYLGVTPIVQPTTPPPAVPAAPKPPPSTPSWTETVVKNLPIVKRRTNLKVANEWDRRVQGLLVAAGVLPLRPNLDGDRLDGKFGASTETSVKSFQRRQGLATDGIVGKDTWSKLLGR